MTCSVPPPPRLLVDAVCVLDLRSLVEYSTTLSVSNDILLLYSVFL